MRRRPSLAAIVLASMLATLAAARTSGEAGPPAVPRHLKLATWNLEWLNRSAGLGEVPRSEPDYARLRDYARLLDADIVALQEIDGALAARRAFDEAIYAFHVTADEGHPQRNGFAYRKTLKVVANPDLDGLALGGTSRGADITVDAGRRRLRLLSLHLKSGCWSNPLRSGTPSCAILGAQLPVLERWIDARTREGVAFAVLGDFNRRFDPPEEFWREIDDGDPPESDLVNPAAGRRSLCWGGEHPEFIDHIVLGRRAAAWLVDGTFEQVLFRPRDEPYKATLSDHCPIAVTLDLAGGPRAAAPRAAGLPTYTAAEAPGHIGEEARVCGRVAGAKYAPGLRNRPTFLNLDRPHPHQLLTVVIWGRDRPAFGRPERTYRRQRICVTGRIELYEGKPEIVARRPSQIEIDTDRGTAGPAPR